MKYSGSKEVNLVAAIPILVWILGVLLGTLSKSQDSKRDVLIAMIVITCVVVGVFLFFLLRYIRPTLYADFREDGIHVIARKKGELAFIDWNDVKECRGIPRTLDAPKIFYGLLIFQRDAPFGDRSISMFRKHRMADSTEISEHMLDAKMEQLREGTITVEEFKNQPYLFFIGNDIFGRCQAMWAVRRHRCRVAENEETADDFAE